MLSFINAIHFKTTSWGYKSTLPQRIARAATAWTAVARMSPAPVPLSDTLDVHIVPILSDNFSYLLHDKATRSATLVDPADPQPLLDLAAKLNATIKSSLTTHHHWDHAGGNEQLALQVPGLDIVGSAYETAPGVTNRKQSGDHFQLTGTDVSVRALRTPCHTNGHLCFALDTPKPAVFTGDTLFVAGCGKFFEGSGADMEHSLNEVLAGLPDDTLVFCGHEYTVTNLKFAATVDPQNVRLKEKLEWAKQRVKDGLPTVPSTMADEKETNPFMRTSNNGVKAAISMETGDAVAVMNELRNKKNNFRP